MSLRLLSATTATPTPTPTVTPTTSVTPTPTTTLTPTPTPSPATTPTLTSHGTLILWLVVGGIIAAGIVIIIGRNLLKDGKGGQAASLIRSWIAISLVIGLLVFCIAALLTTDSSLQNTLFGGLIASTSAAIAFYFSSKGADQARADILNAVTTIGQGDVKPSAFSKISPPDAKVGDAYTYPFTADGSPTPTYWLVSGSLPPGLVLDSDGTLRGKPTQPGPYPFAIAATNSAGLLRSPDLTVTISVP